MKVDIIDGKLNIYLDVSERIARLKRKWSKSTLKVDEKVYLCNLMDENKAAAAGRQEEAEKDNLKADMKFFLFKNWVSRRQISRTRTKKRQISRWKLWRRQILSRMEIF